MCFVSVVMEQYQPYIPPADDSWRWPEPVPGTPATEAMRELIDSFKKAVEAAHAFDRLTGQPDCEDPEKAKLIERVAELERRLDAIAEAAK